MTEPTREGSQPYSSARRVLLAAWQQGLDLVAEHVYFEPFLLENPSVAVAILLLWIAKRRYEIAAALGALFLSVQLVQARRHANDFRDDLAFWQSASKAVPGITSVGAVSFRLP